MFWNLGTCTALSLGNSWWSVIFLGNVCTDKCYQYVWGGKFLPMVCPVDGQTPAANLCFIVRYGVMRKWHTGDTVEKHQVCSTASNRHNHCQVPVPGTDHCPPASCVHGGLVAHMLNGHCSLHVHYRIKVWPHSMYRNWPMHSKTRLKLQPVRPKAQLFQLGCKYFKMHDCAVTLVSIE